MRRSVRSRLDFPHEPETENEAKGGAQWRKPADMSALATVALPSPLRHSNHQSPDMPSSASAVASPAQQCADALLHLQRQRMEHDLMFNFDESHGLRPPPVHTPSSSPSMSPLVPHVHLLDSPRSVCPSQVAHSSSFDALELTRRNDARAVLSPLQHDIDIATVDALRIAEYEDGAGCRRSAAARGTAPTACSSSAAEGQEEGEEESSSQASCVSSAPVEAANSHRATPTTASACGTAAGRGQTGGVPSDRESEGNSTLLAEQSIVLEGWVTKYSDKLNQPRRRWLVVCDHRVFAFATAHGYLRTPAPRPADGNVAGIGGSATMALDLRRCAALPSDTAPDEFVLIPLHGHRKRIRAGDSRERALWLLALQQSCAHAPPVHALPPLARALRAEARARDATERTAGGGHVRCVAHERLLLRTPVGHVHCVTVTPRVTDGARDDSARAPLVCVHGAGGSSAEFDALLVQLSSTGRRVVAVDLPGCGHSDRPERARQASSQAIADALAGDASALSRPNADAVALMAMSAAIVGAMAPPDPTRAGRANGQCARRVCLLGSGFSGSLACLRFAATHPDKVGALVLADCAAPHGAAHLLRALAGAVACGVLVIWAAQPLASVRAAAGRLQPPAPVGESESAALRSFGYCAEVSIDQPRAGAPAGASPSTAQPAAGAVEMACARSAWTDAVLSHLAKYS
ncbi:hypothetical protein KFE25_010006 [Diacronema lutheri]|uniref:PH domain-containing protein n=1 Tax=Diacronema lutheri TaxID=2081491 RepID=A0A8J5XHY0_DIALT|nr:hypothetical protein KFE25_010006 [Diacronema lutheri]